MPAGRPHDFDHQQHPQRDLQHQEDLQVQCRGPTFGYFSGRIHCMPRDFQKFNLKIAVWII